MTPTIGEDLTAPAHRPILMKRLDLMRWDSKKGRFVNDSEGVFDYLSEFAVTEPEPFKPFVFEPIKPNNDFDYLSKFTVPEPEPFKPFVIEPIKPKNDFDYLSKFAVPEPEPFKPFVFEPIKPNNDFDYLSKFTVPEPEPFKPFVYGANPRSESRTFEPVAGVPYDSHNYFERHTDNTYGIRNVGASAPHRVFEPTPVGLRELNPAEINQRGHQKMLDRLTDAFNPFEAPWNPFKP